MKISLIGMSGIGKSYWSKQLAMHGFKHFCCDDLIEQKLEPELKKLGFSGIHEMALWMGQPFDSQYAENSKKYLDYEYEVLTEILSRIEKMPDKNIVIDTTGSLIYLPETILKKLAKLTTIVYLPAPENIKKKMYELYLQEPKPVIWGDVFHIQSAESNLHALQRSYPILLQQRSQKYAALAKITLDYPSLHSPHFSWVEFLNLIKIDEA